MRVGLDFDNTIVNYDRLFHRLACERELIDPQVPATKTAVRDAIRAADREPEWTELQGLVYGPRITEAEPFPGVREFLRDCQSLGISVCIISHKTRHPFRGPAYDLHHAAHEFLAQHGFYDPSQTGLTSERVFLEPTLVAKLKRIEIEKCHTFVDDLPEVLLEGDFPETSRAILFDPSQIYADHVRYRRVHSWPALTQAILDQEGRR